MKECCANCKNRYKLKKFDYSREGCDHADMDGFICMAFASEKQATWMVGINERFGICECFVSEGHK